MHGVDVGQAGAFAHLGHKASFLQRLGRLLRRLVAQPHPRKHEGVLDSAGQDWQDLLVVAQELLQVGVVLDVADGHRRFPIHIQFDHAVLDTVVRDVRRLLQPLNFVCRKEPGLLRKVHQPVVVRLVLCNSGINKPLGCRVGVKLSHHLVVFSLSFFRVRSHQPFPATRNCVGAVPGYLHGNNPLHFVSVSKSFFTGTFHELGHANQGGAAVIRCVTLFRLAVEGVFNNPDPTRRNKLPGSLRSHVAQTHEVLRGLSLQRRQSASFLGFHKRFF